MTVQLICYWPITCSVQLQRFWHFLPSLPSQPELAKRMFSLVGYFCLLAGWLDGLLVGRLVGWLVNQIYRLYCWIC